ncbi:MAG: hypothetical protein AAFP77_16805 [Bacteroidota bacterium]
MTFKTFFRILRRNFLLMLAGGLLAGGAAYWLMSQQKQEYVSEALVSTGIISSVSIKNTTGGKSADRDYAQNELENLISLATAHKTREELSTRLLAYYLSLSAADSRWISTAEFDFLHEEVFTAQMWSQKGEGYEETLANLIAQRDAHEANDVQKIIYSDEAYFGIEYLEEQMQVYRKGNSDLLQFIYKTTDAAVCRHTLNMLLELFMEKHKDLKKNQSSEVSGFFAEATQKSADRLEKAESALLQFRVQNKIINYNEQTRTIAIRKEDLDELRFRENMNLQGVAATRERVETELGNRSALSDLNEGLLSLRQEMSQVSEQLAKLEIAGEGDSPEGGIARKRELQAREGELQEQMRRYVQQRFDFQQSPSGVKSEALLDEWLETIVAEEQGQAKMEVITQRQQEFSDIYGQYAPWGSQLKELQREIDLAEKEYLENLHSYNQALLHQQHTLMASNLELIDNPYLPIDKPDYKRFLLLILGFIGGSSSVFAVVMAFALLDDSLRTPQAVTEKMGLDVATLTPNLQAAKRFSLRKQNHQAAHDQAMALLLQQIKVETLQKDSSPKLILLTSTRREEGKTWIGQQISELLRAEDNRVLFLHPIEGGALPARTEKDNIGYEMSSRMLDAEQLDELDVFGELAPFPEAYHFVVLEIPALLTGKYPLALLRRFDLSLLVFRANRNWEEADQQALKTLQRATRSPIRVVLNGADLEILESFMGEFAPSKPLSIKSASKQLPYQYDH